MPAGSHDMDMIHFCISAFRRSLKPQVCFTMFKLPTLGSTAAFKRTMLSNWSELDDRLLDKISDCIATPRARSVSSKRARDDLESAGIAVLMPVCRSWMDFARRKLRTRLLRELAYEVGVSQERFECIPHFEVTEEHYADTLARFGYFPSIQSIRVRLNVPARPTFRYHYENFQLSGRKSFDFTVLEATFTLQHLSILSLDLPSGDCFCALPWEALSGLRELHVQLNGNVYQGTFAFLPRLASLEVLKADLDFFSVCCLRFLTNLRCLNMSLAPPEHGHLTPVQACERNNEALLQIARLSKLENLQFFQPANEAAVGQLSVLAHLTSLQLRLPYNSEPVYSSLWDVQRLFQHNTFGLQRLHYEFMLGAERGLACLSSTHHDQSASDSKAELQFSVPWSTESVRVEPLGEHEFRQAGLSPYSHREALSDPEGYLAHRYRDGLWDMAIEMMTTISCNLLCCL